MPQVIFVGSGVTVEAALGETLLSCIRRSGLRVDSTCDGRGQCGTCRLVARGELSPCDEQECRHLERESPDVRLACRARVLGNVSVTLSDTGKQLQTACGSSLRACSSDSPLKQIELPCEIRDGKPYAEKLPFRITDPEILNKIAMWDNKGQRAFGLTFQGDLIDIRFDRTPLLGAALDIGTTSLALSLFELESGTCLGDTFALNPQTAYGGDVITRIDYCRHNPEGASVLKAEVTRQIDLMLTEALGAIGSSPNQVRLLTAAGNTTMLHILAGINPSPLASAPFTPAFLKTLVLSGDRLAVQVAPTARIMFLPGASAYVGADIIAGLAAIDYRSYPQMTLFVDIGTNGEIILIEGPDRLLGTSCAMGPALEGMNITCGCRAVPGAIDSVALDRDMLPRFTTIGGVPATGICGSGLVDVVACLLESGVITRKGAFNSQANKGLLAPLDTHRYYLTDKVFLSQKDIRQLQLAKSAMASGIATLLSLAGRSIGDLKHVVIGGSFGYHLNARNLRRIGLVPQEYRGPIGFVGNSSLAGASLALLNNSILREMEQVAHTVRVVELGSLSDFSKRFISSLDFGPSCDP